MQSKYQLYSYHAPSFYHQLQACDDDFELCVGYLTQSICIWNFISKVVILKDVENILTLLFSADKSSYDALSITLTASISAPFRVNFITNYG